VVLGGGVSNVEGLAEAARARLPRHVFSDRVVTRVVRHVHGDSSGVRGAAWLWPSAAARRRAEPRERAAEHSPPSPHSPPPMTTAADRLRCPLAALAGTLDREQPARPVVGDAVGYPSDSTAEVAVVAAGRFVTRGLHLGLQGQSRARGSSSSGRETKTEVVNAAWVDSWHQGDKPLASVGTVTADGGVDVRGQLPGPRGPDWGWRTTVAPTADGLHAQHVQRHARRGRGARLRERVRAGVGPPLATGGGMHPSRPFTATRVGRALFWLSLLALPGCIVFTCRV
jgi:hypothetical protein